MTATMAQLDRSLSTAVSEGYGTISIRVVVLEKNIAAAAAPAGSQQEPLDAVSDEMLPETDKRPTSSFLEEPKRGRYVCVFLINGQRQHVWDNQFIMRDLELKYLRNRMLVVVDCDGLKPEAIAELMQGSRNQFFEGEVYSALESRVLATLQWDPDLKRLEEQAEDEIANLQAGDEAVKAALDQLIEEHHDAAPHATSGHTEAGEDAREAGVDGKLVQTETVVTSGESGPLGSEPVLQLGPDVATIRLKPNESRRFMVQAKPENSWKALESMGVTFDPPVKELQVTRSAQLNGEELELKFDQPADFDHDEYPIETTMRASATFAGYPETRILERRVVINPPKTQPPPPPKPLVDDPTYIKVTSRQPIKLVVGGPDVHVKLRWDGKDELTTGNPPAWSFRVSCESPSVEPPTFLTRPSAGKFELLIQAASGLKPGEQLKFDVEALGPGKTLSTAFLADVIEPVSPRKMSAKISGGGQRRPPYELKYLYKKDWANEDVDCFDQPWSGSEPGSFEAPSAKSPLTIFINNDTDLLTVYRESLLARKLAETTIHQRINKYTTHLAYHLYQMYLKEKGAKPQSDGSVDIPTESMMRDEIQRVAKTLVKLMEVTPKESHGSMN
ncbi:MAG: hypothetical protein ACRD8U_00395 [Pyrinomonadaceae bacterium]